MGNLSSQPTSFEKITVESFFPSTGYKITDLYPNIKDIKQTITNVVNFLNDLINYINLNFTNSTFTGSLSDNHFKHLLLFHIVKQTYITDESAEQSPSQPNLKPVYISDSISSFKENLIKFSGKFSEILTHYSDITNFSHDANDSQIIMNLKTRVKKKINDMIHTMMFFEFDFYVVNYVMYMYTSYCVHIFDRINIEFIKLREYNELVSVDAKLSAQSQNALNKKIATSESSLNTTLGDLINYLKKLQDTQNMKKGGATAVTTFGLPTDTVSTYENKLEYVMQLFSNKQNKYFEYRSHLDLFFKKVNEYVVEHTHKIEQIYIQQAKYAITNKEIISKLTEISDALSKNTTQINPWAINEISSLIDEKNPNLHHLSHLGREISNIISDAEKKLKI